MQEDRKDFKPYQVELVFRKQDGICAKCGRTLYKGFIRDHEDGDHSNNSIENLMLFDSQRNHAKFHVKIRQHGLTNPIKRQIKERWKSL